MIQKLSVNTAYFQAIAPYELDNDYVWDDKKIRFMASDSEAFGHVVDKKDSDIVSEGFLFQPVFIT